MDIPMLNMDDENFEDKLDIAIRSTDGSSAWSNNRQRPYDGQPWTNSGARGAIEVGGLTMRDIVDCYVMGFLQSCLDYDTERIENGKWRWEDMFEVNDNPDPMAVAQNMSCNIEKMMGIFPNIATPKEATDG